MSKRYPVSVIMGSISDWDTMKDACDILDELEVEYDKQIISAHRTPQKMYTFATRTEILDTKIIIAGAGGAAHLPGMVASLTTVPVIGVPVKSSTMNGLDSLYSIVQMPKGVPVATVAIGNAHNAGLLAAQILALNDKNLRDRLILRRQGIEEEIKAMELL